jgi:hypothetical protein
VFYGHKPVSLAYLDNPRRDGKGLMRLLPSLNTPGSTALSLDADPATAGAGAAAEPASADSSSDLLQQLRSDDPADIFVSLHGGDVDGDDHGLPAALAPEEDGPPTVRLCVLQAAEQLLRAYAARTDAQPALHLPPCLTSADRAALHNFAERLGLLHHSEGESDSRHLVIAQRARGGANAAASANETPAVDGNWSAGTVKYDPYHW